MEWWDEDPELLGATLGMLAAWDGSGNAAGLEKAPRGYDRLDRVSTASTVSSQSDEGGDDSPMPPPASRGSCRSVNISRERRKQELQYLRAKVADMQRQLGELQHRREELLLPHYRDHTKTQLLSAVPVWENMATRQLQARKKSEVRNAKLKMMLSAQVRVAEDLIRLIQRAQQENPGRAPERLPLDASRRMSHEEQIQRLELIESQWETTIAHSPNFQEGRLQFFDMRVVEHNGRETTTDLITSNVLPFSLPRVEEAMWSLFLDDSTVEDAEATYEQAYEQTKYSTKDTVFSTFTSTSSIGGSARGTMTGKWVVKRLGINGTQRLIVSHSYSEPEGFQNELDGAFITEEVWVRLVDAHELGHTHLPSPLTVIQHVHRSRITFNPHHDLPHPNRAETLTSLFMKQIQEELEWAQQTIENILMGSLDSVAIKEE